MLTIEQLRQRHSVRAFKEEPLPEKTVAALKAEATMTTTHEAGLRFHLTIGEGAPFGSFLHSYGIFRNVSNYLTVVVDTSYPDTLERAGYFAEQFVMKAVGLGLGTCFVGGTFDTSHVNINLKAGQKIAFLVAFGIPAETGGGLKLLARLVKGKSLHPREFFSGDLPLYRDALAKFPFLETGLEAVACAPSALNRQPVRVTLGRIDGETVLEAYVDEKNEKKLIDLGIAKYNFAAACGGDWEWGNHAPYFPSES